LPVIKLKYQSWKRKRFVATRPDAGFGMRPYQDAELPVRLAQLCQSSSSSIRAGRGRDFVVTRPDAGFGI